MNQPPPPPLRGEIVRTSSGSAAAADLTRRGFRVGTVSASTKADFLVGIGTALAFPAYYGRNLDALWDCLTDLEDPTAVVWTGWQELAINDPDAWARIMGLLRDRVREQPAFSVALVAGRTHG